MSQFSQSDRRVVQSPPSRDGLPSMLGAGRYTDWAASPGNFKEWFVNVVVQAGQPLLEEGVGFPVHTLLVDNPTYSWLMVEPGRRWIMPYLVGAIVPVFSGGQVVRVTAGAPPGLKSNTLTANQQIWVGAAEAYLDPADGNPIPVALVLTP